METLIIIIAIMATLHFVYDGIVLPSIRLHLRNKLFVLRDELRKLKIEGIDKNDVNAFWFVHEGINGFLVRLPQLTLMRAVKMKEVYEKNEKLKKEVEKRIAVVENSDNKEIKTIFHKTNRVLEAAVIANMGGWFFYLIPIILLVILISKLSLLVNELIVTPRIQSDRMFDNYTRA